MSKKKACMAIAALVSVCAVTCLISTIHSFVLAIGAGGDIPTGMLMLTLVTFFCTFIIWRGVRQMDE